MKQATKKEIAEARAEQAFWRSVGAVLECSVFGWHSYNCCTFVAPDGFKFTLQKRTADVLLRLAKEKVD